jgi:uncharacterized protein YeeX (DUF496 family)
MNVDVETGKEVIDNFRIELLELQAKIQKEIKNNMYIEPVETALITMSDYLEDCYNDTYIDDDIASYEEVERSFPLDFLY